MSTGGARERGRRVNPTGGGNEPWKRQGPDCAAILRGLEESTFTNWQEFQESPDFHIFERKYIRDNLRRNFETTKSRWEDYHRDGSGGISDNLRRLAGLPAPDIDKEGGFVPGGQEEEDQDTQEGEDEDIDNLQGSAPAPAPRPRGTPIDHTTAGLDSVINDLRNVRLDDNQDSEAMKGTFLQEVTDPDDPSRTRQRLGLYVILPGGVDADTVEVTRDTDKVTFVGLLDGRIGNARSLLGMNLADPNTVRALQASIDEDLRKHQAQGGNNDGSLPAEATIQLPSSPGGLGWRTGFVNPSTNQVVDDPLFFNRLASTDPIMMADTMAFFAFLLENKPVNAATPARGRRDRRAQVAPVAPVSTAPPPSRRAQVSRHRTTDIDNGGSSGSTTRSATHNRSSVRRSSTSVPSPRCRQHLDANNSYVEESDEAVLHEVPINIGGNDVSGSFESAIDSFEELGQPHTVVSEY